MIVAGWADGYRNNTFRTFANCIGAIRAPHPVQWLSDNGSIFAARRTRDAPTVDMHGKTFARREPAGLDLTKGG